MRRRRGARMRTTVRNDRPPALYERPYHASDPASHTANGHTGSLWQCSKQPSLAAKAWITTNTSVQRSEAHPPSPHSLLFSQKHPTLTFLPSRPVQARTILRCQPRLFKSESPSAAILYRKSAGNSLIQVEPTSQEQASQMPLPTVSSDILVLERRWEGAKSFSRYLFLSCLCCVFWEQSCPFILVIPAIEE